MIGLRYSNARQDADLRRDGGNLLTDEGLETAVLISLFTDRRAEPDDELPDDSGDLGGYWGDVLDDDGRLLGSRLWLLRRSKTTADARRRAREYALEALQWLKDDGVAGDIEVAVERQDTRLALRLTITKPDKVAPPWVSVWELPYAF